MPDPIKKPDEELERTGVERVFDVALFPDRAIRMALLNLRAGRPTFEDMSAVWTGQLRPTSADVLEAYGVGQMGSVNLPLLGEVTGRGAVGLGADIFGSALNLLGGGGALTKTGRLAAKGLSKGGGPAALAPGLAQRLQGGQAGLLNIAGRDIAKPVSRLVGRGLEETGERFPKIDRLLALTPERAEFKQFTRGQKALEASRKAALGEISQNVNKTLREAEKAVPRTERAGVGPKLVAGTEQLGRLSNLGEPDTEKVALEAWKRLQTAREQRARDFFQNGQDLKDALAAKDDARYQTLLAVRDSIRKSKPEYAKEWRDAEDFLLHKQAGQIDANRQQFLHQYTPEEQSFILALEEKGEKLLGLERKAGVATPTLGAAKIHDIETLLKQQSRMKAKQAQLSSAQNHVRVVAERYGEDAQGMLLDSLDVINGQLPKDDFLNAYSFLRDPDGKILPEFKSVMDAARQYRKATEIVGKNADTIGQELKYAFKSYAQRPGYVAHIARDEIIDLVRDIDPDFHVLGKKFSDRHASMLERKYGDQTIEEFNRVIVAETDAHDIFRALSQKQKKRLVERVLTKKGFFYDDPAVIDYRRNQRAFRAMTESEFLKNAGHEFGKFQPPPNEGWIKLTETVDGIPFELPQTKGKWFHPIVAKQIMERRELFADPKLLGKFSDFMVRSLGIWRLHALVWRPAFHVQNQLSNAYGAFVAAGPKMLVDMPQTTNMMIKARFARLSGDFGPLQRMAIKQRVQTTQDVITNGKQLWDEIGQGVADTSLMAMLADDMEKPIMAATRVGRGLERVERVLKGQPVKFGAQAGKALEDYWRIQLYSHLRIEGWTRKNALDMVDSHLFSYRNAPEWARKMSHFVPFFLWSYNAVPWTLKNAIRQPGRTVIPIAAGIQAAESGQKPVPERLLPEFLRGDPVIRLNPTGDQLQVWRVGRILPHGVPFELTEAVRNFFGGEWKLGGLTAMDYLVSQLRPDMKLATERLMNRSSFMGQPLFDPDRPEKKTSFLGATMPMSWRNTISSLIPETIYLDKVLYGRQKRLGRREEPLPVTLRQILAGQFFSIEPDEAMTRAIRDIGHSISKRKSSMSFAYRDAAELEKAGDLGGAAERRNQAENVRQSIFKLLQEQARIVKFVREFQKTVPATR